MSDEIVYKGSSYKVERVAYGVDGRLNMSLVPKIEVNLENKNLKNKEALEQNEGFLYILKQLKLFFHGEVIIYVCIAPGVYVQSFLSAESTEDGLVIFDEDISFSDVWDAQHCKLAKDHFLNLYYKGEFNAFIENSEEFKTAEELFSEFVAQAEQILQEYGIDEPFIYEDFEHLVEHGC